METGLRVIGGIDQALMFVAPDDQVKEIREKVFGQIAFFRVGVAVGLSMIL